MPSSIASVPAVCAIRGAQNSAHTALFPPPVPVPTPGTPSWLDPDPSATILPAVHAGAMAAFPPSAAMMRNIRRSPGNGNGTRHSTHPIIGPISPWTIPSLILDSPCPGGSAWILHDSTVHAQKMHGWTNTETSGNTPHTNARVLFLGSSPISPVATIGATAPTSRQAVTRSPGKAVLGPQKPPPHPLGTTQPAPRAPKNG